MRDGEQYRARIEALLEAPLMRSSDVLRLADGRVLEQVSLPQMSRGEPIGRVFSFRDLSEKLAAHQRIEELGRSDVLTGAPNRRALSDRIVQQIAGLGDNAPGAGLRCCMWTWTVSSRSTTRWATATATACCVKWRCGCAARSARTTRWRAWAATNLPC
jgi:hypothetical protein